MLMIYYKARVEKQMSPNAENKDANDPSNRLIEELRQGLERIIATVTNYAIAFEALDGMRGKRTPILNPLMMYLLTDPLPL